MPLQFILGRAGSGKSTYCIKEAAKCEENSKRAILLVPEQYSHQGERALLQEKGYMHDDFTVTSFARLARKLIADSGTPHNITDSAGKAMLVLKAMMNCRTKLCYFRASADKPGYISLFMDMISEFKKGQVTPDSLRDAADATKEKLFSARLSDLACIYEEYNKLLTDRISDGDDDLTLLAHLAETSDYIKGAYIYIDAFYRFTRNELAVIRAFLRCGARVTVSLCLPEETVAETSVFKSVQRSMEAVERMAQEANAPILPPVFLENVPRFVSRELAGLERALAGERIIYTEDTVSDISLYIAKSRHEEVTRAAAAIRRFVAETGTSYRDIAVLAGDYDGYADLINTVFPLYEIPVFADIRRDFLSHPIVLYLFSLFDLLTGISTKSVTAYMKSGFADIAPHDAAKLENFALAAAIEYGDWLDDERFLYKVRGIFEAGELEETDADYLTMKTKLLAPVLELKTKLMDAKTAGERIEVLFSFLEEQKLSDKINHRAATLQKKGLLRTAEEFTEVYNILVETLDMMIAVLGDVPIGLSAMRAVLEAGLSRKSIGVIPTVYDQVSFGDLNRSVIKNVRALFILGANDGSFPPIPGAGELLSDREREFLNGRGIFVAPDTKRLITDAEFSVYAAATVATEKLFVSYAVSSEDGGSARPAMFVTKLKRTFPTLSVQHELDLEEASLDMSVASKQSAYNFVLTHIAEKDTNETIQKLYQALLKDDAYREKLLRASEYTSFKNTAGRLSPDAVSTLYGDTLLGSVSRFERFTACPFSFFVEYGLKAKERKVLKVEAPDIGTLLHEIIERFSAKVHAQGKSFRTITKAEQQSLCDNIMDEMFGAMYIKNIYSAGRVEALKNRMKSLVAKSVWALCTHVARGNFEPSFFEIGFGQDGEMPPVTVPLPDGGEVVLSGRIDRIDTLTHEGELYLKIIDYKSGSKGYSLADIYNGSTLQLAVYMLAATAGLSEEKSKPARFGGMFYFHLDDPVAESTPEKEADAETVLKAYKMSGLVSGDPAIARAMDCGMKGWSAIIPVYMKADETISEKQSKTATFQEVEKLKRHILTTVRKIGAEIKNGTVDIRPVRNKNYMPCDYCKYITVCGYDPTVHPCRKPQEFDSDAEIWEAME